MTTAKPLRWRKPTDHPQDDQHATCVADGIGGRYSICEQRAPMPFLLWFADDEFIWEQFDTVEAAKARAETDWQQRFADLIAAAPSPDQPSEEIEN